MDMQELAYDRENGEAKKKRRELPENLLLTNEYEEIRETRDDRHHKQTGNYQLRFSGVNIHVKVILQFYRDINLKDSVFGLNQGSIPIGDSCVFLWLRFGLNVPLLRGSRGGRGSLRSCASSRP